MTGILRLTPDDALAMLLEGNQRFVVRTAGHVAGTEVLGSIEFGVSVLGCPLVVVLGHESCGAIAAACAAADGGSTPAGFVRDVVERVMPSVLAARAAGHDQGEQILHEHIRHSAGLLLERSRVLAERVADGRLALVGLSYRLADGSARLVAAHGLSRAAV
ncbi:carbonic anhydrase [Nonomuraea longispora]|uniref:Carbonic anhydrase n=1 Tax=Nonomuraea longispora TaxID=1848320 RepID=A0A4R4N5E8_9ACTN|nr:carbonic anhydrase [Nonomuraea longispora]TDC03184.1 carbonic anhydrase [Nonomuraea longispora]